MLNIFYSLLISWHLLFASSTVDIRPTNFVPTPSTMGSFRIRCSESHVNSDDSIVAPGIPNSTHEHTYLGNTKSDAASTYESLSTSGASTCIGGIANRSSYWFPTMFDGNGDRVQGSTHQIYYKSLGADANEPITNIPNGMKLIAGDSKTTTPQKTSVVEFLCRVNNTNQILRQSNVIPPCFTGQYILATISFPNCWDGQNIDSPNHKSHVTYKTKGDCPATHPKVLPHVTFKLQFPVKGSTQGWHVSSDKSGQAGGTTMHADWREAWDKSVRQTWTNKCVKTKVDCGSGNLGDGTTLFFKS